MLRQLKRRLGQGGDTIIEVLVVLTVLGLAISISYATANRSLLNARQAQENTRATVLAQSQIETLRTLATAPSTDNDHYIFQFGPGQQFCISNDNSGKLTTDLNNKCTFDNGLYQITVTNAGSDTLEVKVVWDNVLGQGKDSVTLSYRLHQLTINPLYNSCQAKSNLIINDSICLRDVS